MKILHFAVTDTAVNTDISQCIYLFNEINKISVYIPIQACMFICVTCKVYEYQHKS